MSTVGVIVNPIAGKDIRRLVAAASHTSDSAKIGIVRRVIISAVESGADRVLVAGDPHRLAERAVVGLDLPVEVLDEPVGGTRADSSRAAARLCKEGAGAVVVLGGDGTCRDVAIGWPDAPLIAISTGTNNVYPSTIDGTSAGSAAGFVAAGAIDLAQVLRRTKRISVRVEDGSTNGEPMTDVALVDVALVDTTFVGARAVSDPRTIRLVVASVATPSSTGLSSIAGRVHPVDRWEPGGVLVRLGPGGRRVRVPLAPGSFTTMEIAEVRPLADGERVLIEGPGVLAYDGERDRRLSSGSSVSVAVESTGPLLVDVDRTLALAAQRGLFDERSDSADTSSRPARSHSRPEESHGH